MIATKCNVKVVYDIPDETEKAGYSTATKATMTSRKAQEDMNWNAIFSINKGISKTIEIIHAL